MSNAFSMPPWAELFQPGAPIVETIVRGTVMFLAIFVMMRVTGQRESGVHSLTDLLVVLLVAEAAAHGMAGEANGIIDSVVLIATILAWSILLDAAAYRWPSLAPLIKSRARPLIRDGQINHRQLRREFMSVDELMAELRLHGITELHEVSRAYLEVNGMVSVIQADKKESSPPPKPPAIG
jgi:uncharacterized membrane protein YcaP (DUF421 family)